ncbi:MAG: sigma-70 family RNA polymerase sigma factor [Mangrovibacterium sp.]|nr:sigma-70 family RNA polymerase sigma factor [Mangrovibacterium sp.]
MGKYRSDIVEGLIQGQEEAYIYLFQSVYHNSINYIRELKKKEALYAYLEESFVKESPFFFFSEEESGQSLLLLDDLAEEVETVVSQLPPQQQKVFRLKRFEGKKNREIAELLEISVKTVELHLSKATMDLREK